MTAMAIGWALCLLPAAGQVGFVMSLATSGESGPHAANVLYVRDDFALLWVSDPISQHSREIVNDARVAATIAADYAEIAAIRGVQISGRARAITGASGRSIARRLLEARYRPLQESAFVQVFGRRQR
jgi:uncharacterized protein YhbP (UPF0306 family)